MRKYGNGWLKALPTSPALSMPCWAYREALRYRLGMPSSITRGNFPVNCTCSRRPLIDSEGIHLRVCPLSIGLHCTMHGEIAGLIG